MNLSALSDLASNLEGEFYTDETTRRLYSTDASAYKELPLAVATPKTEADIKAIIKFANETKTGLIPRAAGTSLAGQVVGNGIVVDVSKHLNKVLEINEKERWVRVQPGIIRDDLNKHLAPYGLMFGPETSTANRAMIGGMIGNNSCGSNSIIYGSTREHLIAAKVLLSDGAETTLKEITDQEFISKANGQGVVSDREASIYYEIHQILSDKENVDRIHQEFPKRSIPRRNTGYALDILANNRPFQTSGKGFNACRLFAGSEGTLGFLTEAKLNLVEIPTGVKGVVCIHFNDLIESLKANTIAVAFNPTASELMDHYILECTKENAEQTKNRFFVEGAPKAILIVEMIKETETELNQSLDALIDRLKSQNLGYHYPKIYGDDTAKVWSLRKAGLGLLGNLPGDDKAVPVVEDTAVDVNDLPAYIEEFEAILKRYGQTSVYYAHAGTGELHMRPVLNLKTKEGNEMFRIIADEVADLVKKYQGSLSGEHGDGRLRGEFIPKMIGKENYELLKRIKRSWDPENIFNPGKIVDTPSMNSSLRYEPGQSTPDIETVFDYSKNGGFLREVEKCNGAGVCRKTELTGGTMCPSYMATKNEKDSTRARANILREMMTISKKKNRFDHEEIKEVMDLCLSCKGCKTECPTSMDMARYKAEFQHQYYKTNGVPLRSKLISGFDQANKLASKLPSVYNGLMSFGPTATIAKSILGISSRRKLPKLHKQTLRSWFEAYSQEIDTIRGELILFCDEFTNYNDTHIGITSVKLLNALGYKVRMTNHTESGRTMFSKGLLDGAKKAAIQNVNAFKDVVTNDLPLVGVEPSALLTFRDEYPNIVGAELSDAANIIARNTFLLDEFLAKEIDKGNLDSEPFQSEKKHIKIHGHCHQKALSAVSYTEKILNLPENYSTEVIPSGCCGMAGSFGYEKEHYEVSMKIGELVLFPAVRKANDETIISAVGTSCRHQIMDGTGRTALHPAEILYAALK
ncbi:MAG: FAD-linked oxidase C-terminal domain-containing protein [Cyclobacteriaceae bacterium]